MPRRGGCKFHEKSFWGFSGGGSGVEGFWVRGAGPLRRVVRLLTSLRAICINARYLGLNYENPDWSQ